MEVFTNRISIIKNTSTLSLIYGALLSGMVLLTGCSGDGSSAKQIEEKEPPAIPQDNDRGLAIPDNRDAQEYRLLFFGNSHVAHLPEMIKTLIEATIPNKQVTVDKAPGIDYLAERINDPRSVEMLTENEWTHLILQAQKYSQSGGEEFPTDAAESWIAMAKELNVTPILFPEHPQLGNENEGQYVHNIHTEIANKQASCVSPVGLAWDKAISLDPTLEYYHADGNHAALVGRLLTAYVFYEVITGQSADLIPNIDALGVASETQGFLRQVATETVLSHPPCDYE